MHDFFSDLRYAARMLLRNPGFTAIAVIALALGIGANTAMFSVVYAVLLRPLPFADADRLVSVASVNTRRGQGAASYPDFQDFRSRNHTFAYLAASHDDSWALTGAGREAVTLNVAIVSADLFPMAGVRPLMGRYFRPDEDENVAASPKGVVLSHHAWHEYFGSDPGIVGKPITLRGLPYTVFGVMPETFNFPVRPEVYDAWTTFAFSSDLATAPGGDPQGKNRGSHYLEISGKLKPGVTLEQAHADLKTIADALARQYPDTNQHRDAVVSGLLNSMVEHERPALLLLLASVGCVLLVACANVANLLLARANTRRRELAIRSALGAGRFRVIRQVLTESVLLSILGGAAGLLLGAWGNQLLVHFGPSNVARLGEARIDVWVMLFALAASLLTGVLFGLVPALRAAQSDPSESLKEGSRGSTEGIRSNKARSILVVSEVALALMLLASAGLLIRSLDRLNHSQPGYRTDHILTAAITLPEARYKEEVANLFFERLETRLRQIPGVAAAGDIVILPLSGDDMNTSTELEGHPLAPAERPSTRFNIASEHYFETLGIPLLRGRMFVPQDDLKSTPVVLVNEAYVKQYLPDGNPIGKRVRIGVSRGPGPTPLREVVGVVGSVQQDRIGKQPLPEVFFPRNQFPSSFEQVVVRSRDDEQTVLTGLRSILRDMDPDLPIQSHATMSELTGKSLAQPRFQGFLLAVFAGVALILTAVGLYGVISYSVSQRTHEIGTRMALGAKQENILRLVVGQGFLLAGIGVVIGLAGALAVSRFLESLLFEVAPTDPLTLTVVSAIVFVVALLASFVPAIRAANVDPMVALRYE